MQTSTRRTRSMTANFVLHCIAIVAFAIALWSFRLLHDAIVEANQSTRHDSLTFDIPPSDPVAMIIHGTRRYDIASSGVEDYAALLPSGGHRVHVGSPPKVYTPTLFHQMKCLAIIHAGLVDVPSDSAATPTPLVSHCLNYLRQTILCRPNLRLESVTDAEASSEKEYETVCRNWEAIYAAAEKNHKAFVAIHE